jgi:hypothetical protein
MAMAVFFYSIHPNAYISGLSKITGPNLKLDMNVKIRLNCEPLQKAHCIVTMSKTSAYLISLE